MNEDAEREYTAWELAADWWWEDAGYKARVAGGRVLWEEVVHNDTTQTKTDNVRLGRIESGGGLQTFYRYVKPETRMYLVKETQP
jgi:hypothetical protein